VLAGRRAAAPEGSYTKRLFEDSGLLRNKLVEEAQELAEAESFVVKLGLLSGLICIHAWK